MKQFLIHFEHDSKHLGYGGFAYMLVQANSFEHACHKIEAWSTPMVNPHHKPKPFHWNEDYKNARNFINCTI